MDRQAVGTAPWEKWSLDPRPGSLAWISSLCSIQWWKAVGFLSNRERQSPLETKPHFFKGPKHRFFILSQSPWAPVKGGQCKLESPEESQEWEALGRDFEEWLLEYLSGVIFQYHSSHFSWEEQVPPRGISLGKNNYPTLWATTCSAFWNPASLTWQLFPSTLHLNPCWGDSYIRRLMGCQRPALRPTFLYTFQGTGLMLLPHRSAYRNTCYKHTHDLQSLGSRLHPLAY